MVLFRLKFIVVASLMVLFFGFAGGVFAAAETCDCWCGKDEQGAQKVDQVPEKDCPKLCTGKKLNYIICTNDRFAAPPMNVACWTEADCEVTDSEGKKQGVWGEDYGEPLPADCAKSPAFGLEMQYCYSPPIEIKLGVSLGDVDSVKDIGEYLNAVYAWLLYAAVLLAAVMIIVGGVEYMIGAGAEKTQQAKARIIHALVGFSILILIEVILSTVNPAITQLNVPRVKKVRQVAFVDPETACDRLLEHGFTLEFNGETLSNTMPMVTLASKYGFCGEVADVVGGPNGSNATIEECNWVTCADEKACYFGQDRSQPPTCIQCRDISPGAGASMPTPSSEVCNAIEFGTVRAGDPTAIYRDCVFSIDGALEPATNWASYIGGTCAEVMVSCKDISSCRDYDKVLARSTDTNEIECNSMVTMDAPMNPILKEICHNDPCKVAPSGTGQRCVMVTYRGASPILGFPDSTLSSPSAVISSKLMNYQHDCVNTGLLSEGCRDKDNKVIKVGGIATEATSCLDEEECW